MLTIRAFTESDRETIESHLMLPSIASIMPEFFSYPLGVWVETIITDPRAYAVVIDSEMIGACRLDKNKSSDFSYWIHPHHQGQGYATQINHKLCRIAISLGWKQIGCTCDPENKASQAVLTRCGFQQIRPDYWLKYL